MTELPGIWHEHTAQLLRCGWFDKKAHPAVGLDDLDVDFEQESREPRPNLNGRLLINPAGTIWLVVDGYAKGYTSEALFTRIHYWYIELPGPGPNPRVALTRIQSIDFIAEKEPWSSNVGLVRNPAGTVAIYDTDSEYPNGRLYGVPSAAMMRKYQLDWDDVRPITNDEFNSYPMPIILT